ncbi:lysophospholipase-like protein 1 isoform X2 [Belonocnema kinseyi]|nr:lysophospholipase-like protein 1 isoform X2 [Belonocnema kinseyi]
MAIQTNSDCWGSIREEPLNIENISRSKNESTAIVYFFHGSGSNGHDIKTWLKSVCNEEFSFPHINVIYPDAPLQRYRLNQNMESNVWFNREDLSETSKENKESVNKMCKTVLKNIEEEVAKGTPYNRIVLGGFSMGGALALHLAYRFNKPFAGCFVISSFLNNDSLVYEALDADSNAKKLPLIQLHGESDTLIPLKSGLNLQKKLGERGVNVTFKSYANTDHEIVREEVVLLKEWLLNTLPPL